MKLKFTLYALALLGVTGMASAAGSDESAQTIDLSAVNGGTYFIKCENGREVSKCQSPSLWQNSNPVEGLQSGIFASNAKRYDPDTRLLA